MEPSGRPEVSNRVPQSLEAPRLFATPQGGQRRGHPPRPEQKKQQHFQQQQQQETMDAGRLTWSAGNRTR